MNVHSFCSIATSVRLAKGWGKSAMKYGTPRGAASSGRCALAAGLFRWRQLTALVGAPEDEPHQQGKHGHGEQDDTGDGVDLGLHPRRTAEKISIGRVVEPGPETKLASTRSSSDRVKDSSQPATIEGAIMGTVISRKVFHGGAPRSIAASSMD